MLPLCYCGYSGLLRDDGECLIWEWVSLLSLREETRDLWQDYYRDKLDVAATAVGANMAPELARSMEDEMTSLLKKHGAVIALLPEIFDGVCQSLGIDPLDKELSSDDMYSACSDIGASFLWNIASLLDAFVSRRRVAHRRLATPVAMDGID
ncbi:hypothetical protein B0J13DRAFT_533754 [Dactylonectria estremocensis]|uniref:DUF6604 domain-containing protein n=1 Tax=Dactylonectria estremocensis TaxID=1079267 RepID=A0A9P9D751_9HYPO|nr:hypothetical protein B0J13DRAFT_533754 [Dactylonectria estremocensis]